MLTVGFARRVGRSVADYLSRAPGTHVLLLVVSVTTLMQRGLDATTDTRVLREASTNLVQMSRAAPRVLFLSAFLLDHGHLVVELVLFSILMVPVERWIGTYRWLAVFAAGHVGATFATTIGIWLQVRSGGAGRASVYPVDVGASYGLAAVAAVLARRLPRPLGALAVVWLAGYYVRGVVIGGTFTDWGHLAAFAIGLALAPIVRPRFAPEPTPPRAPGRLAQAWQWLSTPPPARPNSTAHVVRALGWFMIASAALLITALAITGDTDVQLPPARTPTSARVLGPITTCGPDCRTTLVRYRVNGLQTEGTLALPAGVVIRRGDSLNVVVDPARPTSPRLPTTRRVNPTGLFGALAAILASIGVATVTLAHRHQRQQQLRTQPEALTSPTLHAGAGGSRPMTRARRGLWSPFTPARILTHTYGCPVCGLGVEITATGGHFPIPPSASEVASLCRGQNGTNHDRSVPARLHRGPESCADRTELPPYSPQVGERPVTGLFPSEPGRHGRYRERQPDDLPDEDR